MEFFLLFILNIFTGAVIYLILSLKIERTSATFQEQKLKKEMGEIITEFNSTAERNITLLENRINILKKLLNEKGDFRGIDLVIGDEKIQKAAAPDRKKGIAGNGFTPADVKAADESKKREQQSPAGKNDGSILVGIIDKISNISRDVMSPAVTQIKVPAETDEFKKTKKSETARIDYVVDSEIDFSEMAVERGDGPVIDYDSGEQGEDLAVLFSNTSDKYSLIADLHSRGYSVDDIARHSGLPSGEVRLVISLNR